jgi:hypothetical protein
MCIGVFGGLGFDFPADGSGDMLSAITLSPNSSPATLMYNTVIIFSFPILVYVTSIPVSMLIVRMNLLSSGLLEPGMSSCVVMHRPS